MTERTGMLPNPPLFYVLASVRFQPWLNLQSKIAEIQDELRDRFPLANGLVFENYIPKIGEAANSAPELALTRRQAWSFMAPDRALGCQISVDQIIVHTRSYSTFDRFAEAIAFVVGAVEKHARHFDVNSVGVRYLDKIAPAFDETLAQYLQPGFLPQPLEAGGLKTLGGISQMAYATDSGILQARFWTGEGYAAVPDDLAPLYLLTQDLAGAPETAWPLERGQGTLDSDSIWSTAQPAKMVAREIVAKLRDLHVHANAFFRNACSEHAFKNWRREK